MIEVNRYRKIYAIKYYILAVMLAMASLWIIPTVIDAPGKTLAAYRRLGGSPARCSSTPAVGIVGLRLGLGRSGASSGTCCGFKVCDTSVLGGSVARRWLLVPGTWSSRRASTDLATAVRTGLAESAEQHKTNRSSLQIGLLDPIALTVRSMTTSVLPTVHKATESVYTEPREYWQAWIVGLIFIGFLFANWWIPRFFCRAICPLGALLGLFSRFSLWRIDRDPVRCTDCDLCLKSCEGASDPHQDLRKSECFVCLNCIEDCPHDALSFRFLPRKASEVA